MVSKKRTVGGQPEATLDDLLDRSSSEDADTIRIETQTPSGATSADDPTTIGDPAVDSGTGTTGAGGESPDEGDEDGILDDEEFLPQQRKRTSRVTVALAAVLILLVGAFGGIWIQKQFGAQSAAAAFPGGQSLPGGGSLPSGMAGGQGFPGGGQGLPSGMPSGQGVPGGTASGAPDGTGGTGGVSSDTPAVVGTVSAVKGDQITVKDFGGKAHQVTISSSTTLTAPYNHGVLKSGDTVSVVGTTSDKTIVATSITVS